MANDTFTPTRDEELRRNSFARASDLDSPPHDGEAAEGDEQGSAVMEKAQHMQEMASEKAGEVGSKLQETADMGVNRAAEGLDQASTQLRDRATEMGGVQEKLGVRVADGLDKTSGYLREREAQEIWTDVEKFVKEHPMQAAVSAAVAGYLVAKVLK